MKLKNLLFPCLFFTLIYAPQSFSQNLTVQGKAAIGGDTTEHTLTITSPDSNNTRLIGPLDIFGYGARLNFGDADYVYLQEDVDDGLTIFSSFRTSLMGGNVGIGTTSPSDRLHIENGNVRITVGNMMVDDGLYQSLGPIFLGPDADTTGDDEVIFINNLNQEVARIASNGYLGIGTISPSAPITVRASSDGDFFNNGIHLLNEIDSAGQNAIITTRVAGGNSGDPYFTLDVTNESGWSIGIDNDDENKLKIGSRPDLVGGNTRMTFQNNGNIGIGTTSPKELLHLMNGNLRVDNGQYQSWGPITLQPDVDSSGDDFVRILNSFGDLSWQFVQADSNISWIGYHTPNNGYIGYSGIFNGFKDMDFGTGSGNTGGKVHLVIQAAPKLTVDSTGFVGIGTTAPTNRLTIQESSEEDVVHAKGNGNKYYRVTSDNSSNAGIRMIRPGTGFFDFAIEDEGGVLRIKTTDNDTFASNELLAQFLPDTLGDYEFTVFGSALASGGTWTNSDRKVKRNVRDLDNSLDKLMKLQPKTYFYRHDDPEYKIWNFPEEKQLGLIAQELEAVFPELVGEYSVTPDDGSPSMIPQTKTVNYTGLIPVLIGAVKELNRNQQDLIPQLREENERLKDKTDKLEKVVKQQEAKMNELADMVNRLANQVEGCCEGKVRGSKFEVPGSKFEILNSASLDQNVPNPFDKETTIRYFIPEEVKSAALQVATLDGKVVGYYDIDSRGKGEISIEAGALQSGTYFYSLILDGQILDTKKMALTK